MLLNYYKETKKIFQAPSWKGYGGTFEKIDDTTYLNSGEIAVVDENGELEITEIPVRMASNSYKEVLEFFLTGERKDPEKKKKGGEKDSDSDSDDEQKEQEKGKGKKKKDKDFALIK